jgi:hypothetical protein
MEINLTEVKTMNPYDTYDYNSYEQQNGENYWEKPKVESKDKRKKTSFDDILSNMNLVVNKQGVLQYMMPNQNETYGQEYNYNPQEFKQQTQERKQPNKQPQSIDKSVKHSYIYNKYFKDYASQNAEKREPLVPKTIEEYRQMLQEERMKVIQHRKMIEQVKSTKMLFTSHQSTNSDPKNINASKNNLRMMKFK